MRNRKGFTLIELLVVILIIGILLALIIPNFVLFQERARRTSVKNNMHVVQTALEAWAVDHYGHYPNADGEPFAYAEDFSDIRMYFPGGDPYGLSGTPIFGKLPTNPYTANMYNDQDVGADPDILYGDDWDGHFDAPGTPADNSSASSYYIDLENPNGIQGTIGVTVYCSDADDIVVDEYGICGWGRDPTNPMNDRNPSPDITAPIYFVLHN